MTRDGLARVKGKGWVIDLGRVMQRWHRREARRSQVPEFRGTVVGAAVNVLLAVLEAIVNCEKGRRGEFMVDISHVVQVYLADTVKHVPDTEWECWDSLLLAADTVNQIAEGWVRGPVQLFVVRGACPPGLLPPHASSGATSPDGWPVFTAEEEDQDHA